MAGKQPFILTGANAKLKVNGRTLAFATNVSYRIEVIHEDPRVLGMYEGHSLEPVSYKVSGGFSIIRYVADVRDQVNAPSGVSNRGNGPGAWGDNKFSDAISSSPSPREFFNPRLMDRHSALELEIFQKLPNGQDMPVAKIKGMKFTLNEFTIGNKKSPAMQQIQFMALYADEDSFRTAFSGEGQQFQ